MRSLCRSRIALMLGAMLSVLSTSMVQAGTGPLGTYYITDLYNTDLGQSAIDAIHGDSINPNPDYTANGQEGAIAVFTSAGVVRTMGYNSGKTGGEYKTVPSLTLTQTGNTYKNPFNGGQFFDGTTDGTKNYTVDYTTGKVYSTSTTWGGTPTQLFNTLHPYDQGITYDATNNSLWIQNYDTATITDYSMTGTKLSSFTPGAANGGTNDPTNAPAMATALAMDIDHTLWFAQTGTSGTIFHYATNGTYLGSNTYSGVYFTAGGEIGGSLGVPEPATMISAAVAGLATFGLVIVRRRRVA